MMPLRFATGRVTAGLFVIAVALWCGRSIVLGGVGSLLVHEDPIEPADVVAVSIGAGAAGPLEAVRLVKAGVASRILVTTWRSEREAVDAEIRKLGVPLLSPPDLVRAIVSGAGVPLAALDVTPDEVDGTGSDMAALGAHVRKYGISRVLLVTARSHTGRARWLLQRAAPHARISSHAPVGDRFDPRSWWSTRDGAREGIVECLRWANDVVLGDAWTAQNREEPGP